MKLLPLLVLALALPAAAQDRPDSWTSGDKRAHFISGVIISTGVTRWTGSAGWGFVAGCGAGIGGELVDASQYGFKSYHVSYKDAAVECLGGYLGAQTNIWISPNKIVWRLRF